VKKMVRRGCVKVHSLLKEGRGEAGRETRKAMGDPGKKIQSITPRGESCSRVGESVKPSLKQSTIKTFTSRESRSVKKTRKKIREETKRFTRRDLSPQPKKERTTRGPIPRQVRRGSG